MILMENREGQVVPNVTFKTIQHGARQDLTTSTLFDHKRVVLFALPGAFTPTCSTSHLPGFRELYPDFVKCGIIAVYCLSVNDAFVMNAWQEALYAHSITMLPDGNGEFSKGMDMLVDKRMAGFGERSWRYAMVVDNRIIEKMFIEPDAGAFGISSAESVLEYINSAGKIPAFDSDFQAITGAENPDDDT